MFSASVTVFLTLRLCVERPVALTVPVASLPEGNLEAFYSLNLLSLFYLQDSSDLILDDFIYS